MPAQTRGLGAEGGREEIRDEDSEGGEDQSDEI